MNPSGILRDVRKPKDHESTWEETWPDYAISNAITATKLPLCSVFQKKNNK